MFKSLSFENSKNQTSPIKIIPPQDDLLKKVLNRSKSNDEGPLQAVKEIIKNVQEQGDKALFEYTLRFDKAPLTKDTIKVSEAEIEAAFSEVDQELVQVMKNSIANIESYHRLQLRGGWISGTDGAVTGVRYTPLEAVGVYVPGGAAAYPSSVLMSVIPARVAGVGRIVITTPCDKVTGKINPSTLVAARLAGVDEIYKIGGAQAIAALAFGTESVPRVNKIVGPGNIYVALAKREVFGYVGIDSIAGPSEVLIICDETANPAFVAADLLSQAEHDPMAACICITTSELMASKIAAQVKEQMETLERKEIMKQSIENYGAIVVVDTLEEAARISNEIAPEHLELCVEDTDALIAQIKNAGAIFIGNYSPEPLGDYFAGPSHVLPTSGTAKFFSPLNVDDFVKKTSLIKYTKAALERVHEQIELFARSEGLTAHENSVKIRFSKN